METQISDILASVARIETTLTELKDVSVKRLDAHANKIDSLEQTRDRQRGAAKISAVGLMVLGAAIGVLRWLG